MNKCETGPKQPPPHPPKWRVKAIEWQFSMQAPQAAMVAHYCQRSYVGLWFDQISHNQSIVSMANI